MGSGASVSTSSEEDVVSEVTLKQLPEAIEESIYVHEKFPIVIDPSEQAARFLKYQTGAFMNKEDPTQFAKAPLNRALVSSFLNGRTLTLRFPTLEGLDPAIFDSDMFPKEIISREQFLKEDVWKKLLKPGLGDPDPSDATFSSEFAFIICTATDYVPDVLKSSMRIVRIRDPSQTANEGDAANNSGDPGMDQIAALYGASEIIR